MEEKIDFSQAPRRYSMCLNRECAQADTCLRQLITKSAPINIQYWEIISPTYLAALKGACPHYRPATKVRFAKGIINLLDNLPHKQMKAFIPKLTGCFSQRTYYRIRKGERLLSPSEQQKVLKLLKSCGVSHPQEFDAYIEEYEW